MKRITNTTTDSLISSSLNLEQLYRSDPETIDWYPDTVLLLNEVILLDINVVLLLSKLDKVLIMLVRDLDKHQLLNCDSCTQNIIMFTKYTIKKIITRTQVDLWDLRSCFGIFYQVGCKLKTQVLVTLVIEAYQCKWIKWWKGWNHKKETYNSLNYKCCMI